MQAHVYCLVRIFETNDNNEKERDTTGNEELETIYAGSTVREKKVKNGEADMRREEREGGGEGGRRSERPKRKGKLTRDTR